MSLPRLDVGPENRKKKEQSLISVHFIRCLDEFDVFMDSVNRVMAMEMMIYTTKKHKNQQFIFLTPLVC